MDVQLILTVVILDAAAYALAFGAAILLLEILSGPWRRTTGAHWTERARLAFAPGMAVLWLAAVLPSAIGCLGGLGLEVLDPRLHERMVGVCTAWMAAFAGVMTVRYRWLRELWGARVKLRSWVAGWLVILLGIFPHFLVVVLVAFLLPDAPNRRSGIVFGGGILAMVFFARGGGVLLLRLLRVVMPARPWVTQMVEQLAREMKVPGRVKVLELHWAQVNAVAWGVYRAVGFSRPLLEVMNDDEVRAVAAHELAHLMEPRWARSVRVAHMFAYLPMVPVMKYGGGSGFIAGYVVMVTVALGYRRFTRKLERRADLVEREAIADASAYMSSMIKLHQANVTPAVMPGAQTHPHLYDRLLAGGIQPEFPRPAAPSRSKPLVAALIAIALTIVLMLVMIAVAAITLRLLRQSTPDN